MVGTTAPGLELQFAGAADMANGTPFEGPLGEELERVVLKMRHVG